jgi:hypothetical protein
MVNVANDFADFMTLGDCNDAAFLGVRVRDSMGSLSSSGGEDDEVNEGSELETTARGSEEFSSSAMSRDPEVR